MEDISNQWSSTKTKMKKCPFCAEEIQNKEKIEAYGQPVFIFSQLEIEQAVSKAAQHGLHPTGGIDFKAQNKTIGWLGFEYTFIIFTLQKC